ncbi:MAG: tRNA (pseudouridine(54)-N(1))-methyltransferase TrmY [Candidatus Methanomethylicota archaeon]|uniref:tRNA (pseudouridine(54)-N(1))-methyltransferase n=1 Tax=Thermoproteota archaeon TaxID=2056631 RepID=A0A497F0D7_9CREN|nr:MAG: tRNA (pseudouridine(54)-N(1))-methyltransferase TrmY [Candidatus Verstraetearchaeota archaeon]
MKRIFVVKSSTARTAADFPLRDLAGAGGRFDVICRTLIAALSCRDGVRRDVEFYAVLKGPPSPPKTIYVSGEEIEEIPLSEVDVAEKLFTVFKGKVVKGFRIMDMGFEKLVRKLLTEGVKLYYLHEKGVSLEKVDVRVKCLGFILGDQLGLSREEEGFLENLGIEKVCIGPKVYLSSHCIAVVNYELDLMFSTS